MAPGPPQKRGCVSSPCSPRGASPIRGASGPPPYWGLGGPGQRQGMDKTLLSLILYCHRYRLGCGWEAAAMGLMEEARACSEKHLEGSRLGCPDTWLGTCSSSSSLISPCLSSGSGSLVGIDNKIEQAMDLVKSHLMFAVREEVEVLKEQIRDLAERNAALEQENGLLRALASPEQLAQLPSSGVPRLGPPAPNGPSV
uniref:TSC22 domain family member 4 n=1 Tax=Rousettus aegyptiacus TaxID=9407 RepID=A0A7J8F525_ROUAE|nr:TSC22 domain family member 4 [Rousettus aegyptiacus]